MLRKPVLGCCEGQEGLQIWGSRDCPEARFYGRFRKVLVVLWSSCPLKNRRRTEEKNVVDEKSVREIGKKGEAATWTRDNKTRCDGSKPSDTD